MLTPASSAPLVPPDFSADLYRAKFRAAQAADVGDLVRLLRQGGVVVFAAHPGIEAEVERILPPALEPDAP